MKNQGHKFGLRTIAVIEAAKGVAVLVLCIVLLSLLHRDLDDVADRLTDFLRLSPDSRLADFCYDLADRTTGRGIWMAVAVGVAYASGRFLEAYGLWNQRRWGEWLSVITGTVFLPFEFLSVLRHPHWINSMLLIGNLLVVFYILSILMENHRGRVGQVQSGVCTAESSSSQPSASARGLHPDVSSAGLSESGNANLRSPE